jgi:hypothetical protein
MRSAECQVAAGAADFIQVAASDLLADSGQQALPEFVPLPADSDRLPVFAPLVQ